MATWTIEPTTVGDKQVTNNNNGEFIFPVNSGDTDITFTITYVNDNNVSATTQYVLKHGEVCKPCNFSIATTTKLGCEGGSAKFTRVGNK